MSKRSYKQHCLLARSLDVVGERWTLLIIRDLLMGPKRYSDLAAGLPGLGTNLLAERLKSLQADGLVNRKRLPAPASSTVYLLTPAGAELQPTILALALWGVRYMSRGQPGDLRQLAWPFLALRGVFNPELATGLDVVVAFEADEEHVWLEIREGQISTGSGHPPMKPNIRVIASADDVRAMLFDGLDTREATSAGRVEIDGDLDDLDTVLACFAGKRSDVSPISSGRPRISSRKKRRTSVA